MPISRKSKPLSAGQSATLFTQLKNMESAGLPAIQAFEILLKANGELTRQLKLIQHSLSCGKSISEAGFKAGLFNQAQRALIQAAESSGCLATVYGQLANYYAGLARRMKKIKSRLYMPIFVLILALFVQPIPALVKSEITGVDYLSITVGRICIIGVGVYVLVNLRGIVQVVGLATVYDRLQLRLPVIAAWITKRQINGFLFILALMMEAGVAFAEALPKAVATIKNTCLQEGFKPALVSLGTGNSVAETLRKVAFIDSASLQIIRSSELSGKLASSLQHYSQLDADNISLQDEALVEWLPRLVYVLICIWMAYSIIGSQFSAIVPRDL